MNLEQKIQLSSHIIPILPTIIIGIFFITFLLSNFQLSEQEQIFCNQINVICDSYLPGIILFALIALFIFYICFNYAIQFILYHLIKEEKLA